MKYVKPKIVISKCLEFEACRYDGQKINNNYIRLMKNHIDFLPICPEVEIGMGIPRDMIHIVDNNGKKMLIQSLTNKDLSNKMIKFSDNYLSNLNEVDGFILKSKSPSCGILSTKIYSKKTKKYKSIFKGSGFFASKVIDFFPDHPKVEDISLNDIFFREHFFTTIFTIAEFRNIKNFKDLYNYQGQHKYLFMTYNQVKMKQMGKIVANVENYSFEHVKEKYLELLYKLFSKRPRTISNINTQMHIFGYFKQKLSTNKKEYFLDLLEKYKNGLIPISSINKVLNNWSIRNNIKYLINQSYFNPFPKELVIQ